MNIKTIIASAILASILGGTVIGAVNLWQVSHRYSPYKGRTERNIDVLRQGQIPQKTRMPVTDLYVLNKNQNFNYKESNSMKEAE